MSKKSEEKNLPKVLRGTCYVNRSYHYLSEIAHTSDEETKKKLKTEAVKSLITILARLDAELANFEKVTNLKFATLTIDDSKLNERLKEIFSKEKGKVEATIKLLNDPDGNNKTTKNDKPKDDFSNLF